MADTRRYTFVQTLGRYTTKSDPEVNYSPWVMVPRQCGLDLVPSGALRWCVMLARDAGVRGAVRGRQRCGHLPASPPFCCEPYTALNKIKP